jgi:GNAT superfamily N-acetyltransferase
LVVSETHRRQGLGSGLLREVLSFYGNVNNWNAVEWKKPTGWDAESLFLNNNFVITDTKKDEWGSVCNTINDCPFYQEDKQCACESVYVELKR